MFHWSTKEHGGMLRGVCVSFFQKTHRYYFFGFTHDIPILTNLYGCPQRSCICASS